ncbi:MAG: GNAT family N-acetyltransferase [Salibacteraceae bacterium]
MSIRKATTKDLDRLTELWMEIMRFHEGHNPYFQLIENHNNLIPEMITKRIFEGSEICFVFESQLIIEGMIFVKTEDLPPTIPFKKRGYISETIVSKNSRSKGIGEQLVSHAKQYFKKSDCEIMELQVSSKNPEGIKFWKKMGFDIGTHHMLSVLD